MIVEQAVERRQISWSEEITFDGFGAAEELVNFESWNYALPDGQLPHLWKEIETFLAESLMLPTEKKVIIDPDSGFEDEDGRNYREIFERSIEHFQGNGEVVARFEAERDGFVNAERLVFLYQQAYGTLPPFAVASPPGEVYMNDDAGLAKSLTFVGIPVGTDEQRRPMYSLYSIPSEEIEIGKHIGLVDDVASVQESMVLLDYVLDRSDSNSVVAFPAVIGNLVESLDRVAKVLGYDEWNHIDKQTQIAASFVEYGDKTESRRAYLVNWFEEQIRRLVEEERGRGEFAVLDEVMRQIFAAERGGFFLEQGFESHESIGRFLRRQLDGEGYKKVGEGVKLTDSHLYYAEDVVTQREMFMRWMSTSTLAMDSYMATGCGSGSLPSISSQELLGVVSGERGLEQGSYDFWMGELEKYDFAGVSSPTDSTGKYKEYYNYEPGICRKCKKHKEYVAKPKREGTACAGWCSDCEK